MAEFTDQEKELLDKLRKGFERDAKTRSQLEPWQELLDRDATVNANRASVAAKILEGFSGSWAAQYKFGLGSTVTPTGNLPSEPVAGADPQGPPISIRSKTTKLGFRGPPEINFVPYNWRTNTFGNKGPSLVGHPIGFEVVGPTLKSPAMDWSWQVLEGAGLEGGDILRMAVRADGAINVMEPYIGTLEQAYGPAVGINWVLGTDDEPNGGLYVLITDDGLNPGSVPAGRVPMAALDRFADTARYELFRVAQIPDLGDGVAYEIHLHPDKRLSTYFDLPAASVDRSIRAVTVVKPYVTRLQAIPQSGAAGGSTGVSTSGREQTFVVVSPERAASGDNYPPFEGRNLGDGTWAQGGFTTSRAPGTTTPGNQSTYGGKSRLPIPNPVREITGTVESAFAPSLLTGQWALQVPDPTPYMTGLFSSQFPILNISVTQRDDDLPGLSLGTIPNCLGWFDAVEMLVAPDRVVMNRVPETDPQTGLTYWGPGPFITVGLGAQNISVFATLHEPISALWENEFDLDRVDSSRLTNLIDPQWVGRFEKQIADPLLLGTEPAPPPGAGAGRPDRAVFDTRSVDVGGVIPNVENPGNLMDLGFRMVLFPAKRLQIAENAFATPDFDRPITGRELVIDGSIAEKQYIDIDYSSGVVRLSHPPPTSRAGIPDEPSDVIPSGIQGELTNNTRGEVVLYAACVPYSMEDSQIGTGVRLTASDDEGLRDFDTYSTEVSAKVDLVNTTFGVANPYIGVSGLTGAVEIVLDRLWDGPETGVVTIQNGSDQGSSFGLWGYTTKRSVAGPLGNFVTALGGITAKDVSTDPDPSLFPGAQSRLVVLRREVVFRRESFSIPLVTNFASSDTYYGSSTRADILRFQKARLQPQLDGSTTVRPLPDFGFQDRTTGRLSPSKMPYPIGNVALASPLGQYFGEEGILTGVDYQGTTFGVPTPGGAYRVTPWGPSLDIGTDGGAGLSYHGFITVPGTPGSEGVFQMRDNFRFVAKISMEFRSAGQTPKAFIGLVQDSIFPGLTPTVGQITEGPTGGAEAGLPPRYHVVGFQLDDTSPNWQFWTRGSSGVENVVSTTAVSDASLGITAPAYYFVIEVQPYGPSWLTGSGIVKLGVFDENKNLLSTINVTHGDLLPDPTGAGFYVCGGIRRLALQSPGTIAANFHNVSVVLEKDLGTFDLPWLP